MSDTKERPAEEQILRIRDLKVQFTSEAGVLHALNNVNLTVHKGEMLGLVGESGCGKSVTALSIMRLLPIGAAKISGRQIRLKEVDLLNTNERTMQNIRGNRIGMIFQDAMTSLNPTHTIGSQIAETVRRHRRWSKSRAMAHARDMLDRVQIPDAGNRLNAYPHELSGGMRQRVMIAMALSCDPELLIADEPTTALDVTVQAQILELINELRIELGMAVLLITHDLGVVAQTADRVAVMYAGSIVEQGLTSEVFAAPSHGYTAGLLGSLPGIAEKKERFLPEIGGTVPRLDSELFTCAFQPRCVFAGDACGNPLPPARKLGGEHTTRCIRSDEVITAMQQNPIVREWS